MKVDIIIADDHTIIREGIKAVIKKMDMDIRVIGEASNGDELIKLADNNYADIYIIDISMPLMNGFETAEKLIRKYPKSKMIILSMHDSRVFVEKALRCGVKGYVLKDSTAEEITQAIIEVNAGRYYISPKISHYVVHGFLNNLEKEKGNRKSQALTSTEKRVVQLIAEGFSNKEIASQLGISLNTAHVHRNNIMQKLNIHKQADLVRYALKEGISNL